MKSTKEFNSPQEPPVHLKFKNLPVAVQERLVKRQCGEGEGFAFQTDSVSISYFLITIAALWFGLLFYFANDYVWIKFLLVIFSLLTFGAIFLFLHNAYKIWRSVSSRSKCFLLITPLYVIDIYFNDVRYWNLEQLISVKNINRRSNEADLPPQIALTLENNSKTLHVNDKDAEQKTEQIIYYRKLFIEATVRNDADYLDSNDDFLELQDRPLESNEKVRSNNLRRVITFAASFILTVGIMFGGISLNNYYDDKKSWDFAVGVNTAAAYRKYRQTHPNARRKSDADARLQALYDSAEDKYKSALNKGSDPKAVDAVLEMLRYARATQNFRVKVAFERHNEIPPDIVEKLKKELEVKQILPLGDALSDEKMISRETGLLALITDAFRQVIPDDILEFSNDCVGECLMFRVKYKITSDSIYYNDEQEKLAYEDRIYHPGIFIDWDFDLQIPNQPQNYVFSLASIPADKISYEGISEEDKAAKANYSEVFNAEKSFIYDSMVASAFADFKTNLVARMGIGTSQSTEVPETGAEKKTESNKRSRKK